MVTFLSVAAIVATRSLGSQQVGTPWLKPVFTTSTIETSPVSRLAALAIGPQGTIAFVTASGPDDVLMAILDSSGVLVKHFGKRGEGPGEVRSPSVLEVSTHGIRIWDSPNAKVIEYDLNGTFVRSLRPAQTLGYVVAGPRLLGMRMEAGEWRPNEVDPVSGRLREILPSSDTFLNVHFGLIAGKVRSGPAPVPGIWNAGFLLADASRYRIALFRWDGVLVRVLGRDIPAAHASAGRVDELLNSQRRKAVQQGVAVDEARMAAKRKSLLEQDLPFITPGAPIRIDALQRIWVLGMEGDSAYADVFTATGFVGRLHLPCRLFNGSWALAGAWLAVACAPDDPDFDGDAVIKTFRIVESVRKGR